MTSRTHSAPAGQPDATRNRELVSAFCGVATGITRPYAERRAIDDAVMGRPVRPLGVYPRIAEACAKAGGSFYYITRPLYVQLARLRAVCNQRRSMSMSEALRKAKQEEVEAGVSELSLALSCANPDTSVLASFVKEEREAIEAEMVAVEIAEDRLVALTEGK